jgi:hypothetical protein
MSRMPYGVATAEDRDRVAEDCDEAARRRDQASAARDGEAEYRDRRAQDRMQEAAQYLLLVRRLLNATGQWDDLQARANRPVARGLLQHLEKALRDADADRRAAAGDRRAAADDRHRAAEDRFIKAAHREQAAIERAQQPAAFVRAHERRGPELSALAQSACARAEAACQQARDLMAAVPSEKAQLRRSELARLHAQLDTMPVIEQAKGIIMAQGGCGEDEAFDLLRTASQRLNKRVRDLAAEIVTRTRGKRHPTARQVPLPARPAS